MVKAYFYLKDVFNNYRIEDGNLSLIKLQSLKVGGIEQLTAAYFSETTSNLEVSASFWEYSDCTDNGSSITACELGGTNDSWNPFFTNLSATYDSVVDSKNRGSFLQSVSTNLYGLEGFGLGFDKILVPINDIPSGGSTGAVSNGAFYMIFDETQDFYFEIQEASVDGSLSPVTNKTHAYSFNASSCSFSYQVTDLITPGTEDFTQWAFLSGGNAGWIDVGCGSFGGDLGDDPIVTRSNCLSPVTPQPSQSIVEGEVDFCCYQSPVLASSTDNADWKNDINSFLFKRNFSSETINLILEKNGTTDLPIVNDDYGVYYDFGAFGDYPNYKGIQIQWQKVLLLEGPGTYRIRIESNFVSGTTTNYSIPFKLNEYTQNRANGTFRVQSEMDGYLRHVDFDFTGLNWLDGLRVEGFFGNRQP